jgi:hypothetical protein
LLSVRDVSGLPQQCNTSSYLSVKKVPEMNRGDSPSKQPTITPAVAPSALVPAGRQQAQRCWPTCWLARCCMSEELLQHNLAYGAHGHARLSRGISKTALPHIWLTPLPADACSASDSSPEVACEHWTVTTQTHRRAEYEAGVQHPVPHPTHPQPCIKLQCFHSPALYFPRMLRVLSLALQTLS